MCLLTACLLSQWVSALTAIKEQLVGVALIGNKKDQRLFLGGLVFPNSGLSGTVKP